MVAIFGIVIFFKKNGLVMNTTSVKSSYTRDKEIRENKINAYIYTEGYRRILKEEPWIKNLQEEKFKELYIHEEIHSGTFRTNGVVWYEEEEILGLPFRLKKDSGSKNAKQTTANDFFIFNYELLSFVKNETAYDATEIIAINAFKTTFFDTVFSKKGNEERETLIAAINIDKNIITRAFDRRQSILSRLWVLRQKKYYSLLKFKNENEFFKKEYLEKESPTNTSPDSQVLPARPMGTDSVKGDKTKNKLTKEKEHVQGLGEQFEKQELRRRDSNLTNKDRRKAYHDFESIADEVEEVQRDIVFLSAHEQLLRTVDALTLASNDEGQLKEILEAVNGLKPPKKSKSKEFAEATSAYILLGLFQNLGSYIATGEKPSSSDIMMLIAPALFTGLLDLYTGGFAGQLVGAFLSGYNAKPDPVLQKLDDFIENNFNVFKEEVMDRFSDIEKNQEKLLNNTAIIIGKLSGRQNEIAKILRLESSKSKVYDEIFAKLHNYNTGYNQLTNSKKIVTKDLYDKANVLLKNYIEDLSFAFALVFGKSSSTFPERLAQFIQTPVANTSAKSLVSVIMDNARHKKGLISYLDACEYLKSNANFINNYVVKVCTIIEECRAFLASIYHDPYLVKGFSDYKSVKNFRKEIFSTLETFEANDIYTNDFLIKQGDVDAYAVNLTKPSFSVSEFLKYTFGAPFVNLIENLKATSTFHIWCGNHILLTDFYFKKTYIDTKFDYNAFYESYEGSGGESRNYSYKWLVRLKDNYLYIQIVGGMELQYLGINQQGAIQLGSLKSEVIPERYKWYFSLRKTDDNTDEISYSKIDLINGLNHNVQLNDVRFFSLVPAKDCMDRERYKQAIAKSDKKPLSFQEKKEALTMLATPPKNWKRWSNIIYGIAFFDSLHSPVIYSNVLYVAVNDGSYSPACLKLVGNKLSIMEWDKGGAEYKEIKHIQLTSTETIDILRYESTPIDPTKIDGDRQTKLCAYKMSPEGEIEHKGIQYKRIESAVLDLISGQIYNRAYLILDRSKTLKMMDHHGKMVWASHMKKTTTFFYNAIIENIKTTENFFGKKTYHHSKKDFIHEYHFPKFEKYFKKVPDGLSFSVDLYEGTKWGDHGYDHVARLERRTFYLLFQDIPLNMSVMHNLGLRKYITDVAVYQKKEEIPIQGDDDLKHWHKADVNFNRDKDYGPLYFFYRESTLPINYSDLLTDVHIESKEEKKDLWYLSQDGLPAGVTLVEGQLNTGSGNWIRMYVIKISDEDLV